MIFSLCPVNEIKLLASLSFFAVAFITGPATGVTLGWAHGWIVRLTGLAIGSAVGVLAAVVLTNMLDTGGSGSSARRTWQFYVNLRVRHVRKRHRGLDDAVRGASGGDNSNNEIRHDLAVVPRLDSHGVRSTVSAEPTRTQRGAGLVPAGRQ